MTNLTKQDLERGLELAAKATPWPWEYCKFKDNPDEYGVHCPEADGVDKACGIVNNALTICRGMTGPNKINNSLYIAEACNNFPALARQHMALMERVERLEAVVKTAKEYINYRDSFVAERRLKQALAALEPEGGK